MTIAQSAGSNPNFRADSFLSSPKTSCSLPPALFPNPASCYTRVGPYHTIALNCYSLPIPRLISTLTLFSSINKATQLLHYVLFFFLAMPNISALFQLSLTLEISLPTNFCLSKSYQHSKVDANAPSVKLSETYPGRI